jgi:hypothetical protein
MSLLSVVLYALVQSAFCALQSAFCARITFQAEAIPAILNVTAAVVAGLIPVTTVERH